MSGTLFSDLQRSIENYFKDTSDKGIDKKRNIRNRMDYLFQNVIVRSKAKYKGKNNSIIIPDDDYPVFAALIIRSISQKQKDVLIQEWMEGHYSVSDYKICVRLYNEISAMFDDMLDTPEKYRDFKYKKGIVFEAKTAYRWREYFRYYFNYEASSFYLEANELIKGIYEGLTTLAPPHPIEKILTLMKADHDDMNNGQSSIGSEECSDGTVFETFTCTDEELEEFLSHFRPKESDNNSENDSEDESLQIAAEIDNDFCQTSNTNQEIDNKLYKFDFDKVMESCFKYAVKKPEEYIEEIRGLLEHMEYRVKKDALMTIFLYVEKKKMYGWKNITESVGHYPLSASELHHFQMIFHVIKNEPDFIATLEHKTGQKNLLEFFRIES